MICDSYYLVFSWCINQNLYVITEREKKDFLFFTVTSVQCKRGQKPVPQEYWSCGSQGIHNNFVVFQSCLKYFTGWPGDLENWNWQEILWYLIKVREFHEKAKVREFWSRGINVGKIFFFSFNFISTEVFQPSLLFIYFITKYHRIVDLI